MRIGTVLLLISLGLAACGGGGSGSNGTGPMGITAPTALSYASPASLTLNVAIKAMSPTVTGTVTGYSVSPALPSGLSLDTGTGIISGTPTAISAATNYMVTASNSAGSTPATISIVVNDAAPTIAYSSPKIEFATGLPANSISPTKSGGAVVTWSVTPALPAGLTLDTTTGAISGTPAADTALATYTVTASNSGGQATANLAIEVTSSQLLDLGQVAGIYTLRVTSSRVLSEASDGHWDLRDYASGDRVAAADRPSTGGPQPQVDLAGNTFVIGSPNVVGALPAPLEVRSADDGHLLSNIPLNTTTGQAYWWQLASDGSYITLGTASGLKVFSPSGQTLVSRSGDYSQVVPFAAPGQVQIAKGPAGANVVEMISVPSGTSTLSPPFQGIFSSWFLDGSRFLTNAGTTFWVYSSVGVQQDMATLPSSSATGQGNWFWSVSGQTLNVYAVGASASPAASYNIPALSPTTQIKGGSGSFIAVIPYGTPAATIIDLSGATPARADYSLPIPTVTAFAASGAHWLLGNIWGVTLDGTSVTGTPRYLTLGVARSVAGSSNNVAVALSTGSILVMDPRTKATQATIPFSSSNVQLSADGTVLAAMANTVDDQYEPDRTLKIFSLPSGTPLASWPYNFNSSPTLKDMTFAASGTVVAQVLDTSRQVMNVSGGPVIWSETPPTGGPVRLSPDGTLIAATVGVNPDLDPNPTALPSVNLYRGNLAAGAVSGWSPGWVDNNRLLVCQYQNPNNPNLTIGLALKSCAIYDGTGAQVSMAATLDLQTVQMADASSIYFPAGPNTIVSLTSGKTQWMSGNSPSQVAAYQAAAFALARSYVVFPSGAQILAQPQ